MGRRRTRRYADVVSIRSGDRITVEWFVGDVRYTASAQVSAVLMNANGSLRTILAGTVPLLKYQLHAGIRPLWPNVDARVFLDEAAPEDSEALPALDWPEYTGG